MRKFYSVEDNEHCAKALGRALPISRKHAIEICTFARAKKVERVKTFLKRVIEKKEAVPFRRFNWNVGHKPGQMAGRYPIKAAEAVLAIISAAEANALSKGLSGKDLIIKHICAKQGPNTWRYGRHRRRQAKRTHVEVIIEESETLKGKKDSSKKAEKGPAKPAEPVTAAKSTPAAKDESSQTTEKK